MSSLPSQVPVKNMFLVNTIIVWHGLQATNWIEVTKKTTWHNSIYSAILDNRTSTKIYVFGLVSNNTILLKGKNEYSDLFSMLIKHSIEIFSFPFSFFKGAIHIYSTWFVHHNTESCKFLGSNETNINNKKLWQLWIKISFNPTKQRLSMLLMFPGYKPS